MMKAEEIGPDLVHFLRFRVGMERESTEEVGGLVRMAMDKFTPI